MSVRDYYTLAVKTDGVWGPQFGDYDLDVVQDECDEYSDEEYQVIHTGDSQAAINAEIAIMNK